MAKLIIGCGYLGLRVARLWREAGCEVYAVTRSQEKGTKLAAEGLRPIVADVTLGPFAAPPNIETALFAVGFERTFDRTKKGSGSQDSTSGRAWLADESDADQSIHDVYVGGLRNALRSFTASPPPGTPPAAAIPLHQLDRCLRPGCRPAGR